MNFEDVWPQIKEGRLCRYMHKSGNSWSHWVGIQELAGFKLGTLQEMIFEVKRTPVEIILFLDDDNRNVHLTEVPNSRRVKFQEVIE